MTGTSNPATITIDCNKAVTASFSPITYILTIYSSQGGFTDHEGSREYTYGSTVRITAVPEKGWWFSGWTGDVEDPYSAEIILTMDSDRSITANFSKDKTNPLLIGYILAGAMAIGLTVWFIVKRRAS
jgi:hypothetical protein